MKIYKEDFLLKLELVKIEKNCIKNYKEECVLHLDKKKYNECKNFVENVKNKEDYKENSDLYDSYNLSYNNFQPINIEKTENYETNNNETKRYSEISVGNFKLKFFLFIIEIRIHSSFLFFPNCITLLWTRRS